MSMQVCLVEQQPTFLPPTDLEQLKAEMVKINGYLQDIKDKTANEATYEKIKDAIFIIDEIILSLDNSNDFCKIGGFNQLLPLLEYGNAEVIASTAELIADLCQNNAFCQSKTLDLNILPKLIELLKSHSDVRVRAKSLYAISSLCRNNEDSIKCLESTDILTVIMDILEEANEKLTARAAFFLSHLSNYENYREAFYKIDLIGALVKLVKEEDDSSTEHLLNALRVQVTKHLQSRVQSKDEIYNLKEILLGKIKFYDNKEEFEESKEHCKHILALCFPERRNR